MCLVCAPRWAVIPLHSKMWGNSYGKWLQAWATTNRLPLVWANGDESGALLVLYPASFHDLP